MAPRQAALTLSAADREDCLSRWADAPHARLCHPREEHLLPLMVCAGVAHPGEGRVAWRGQMGGKAISALHFG